MKKLKKLFLEEKYFLLLLMAGFLFGIIRIEFILGIDFNFSSIFLLMITKRFGLKRGLITTVIVEGLTYILYGNFNLLILKILEVLFVGYILKRNKTQHIILIDLAFWILVLVGCTAILGPLIKNNLGFREFYFNLFKVCVNSVLNAELADVFVVFFPIKNIIKKKKDFIISFKDIIFHVIVVMVLFPYVISTVFGAIKQYEAIIKTNGQVAEGIKNNIQEYLSTWEETKQEKLILNSKIEVGELKNRIIQITGENEFGVIVKDKSNRVLISNNRNDIKLEEYSDLYYNNEIYKDTYEIIIDRNFNKGEIVYKYDLLKGKVGLFIKISIKNIREAVVSSTLNQLMVLFALALLASGGAALINNFLTKSINRLIEVTGNTQQFINRSKGNVVLKSNVEEINILEQNYENMLLKLKESFDEIQESKSNLERLAYTDYLTGLNNRFAFSKILEYKTKNLKGGIVGLILLDINKFKQINDTLGHAAGDMVLIEVSKRLIALKREGLDIFRQGGDEIAIIIEGTSRESIVKECKNVAKVFEEPIKIFNGEYKVEASIGVSIYPEDTIDLEELMRFSDIAMYRAKTENIKDAVLYK